MNIGDLCKVGAMRDRGRHGLQGEMVILLDTSVVDDRENRPRTMAKILSSRGVRLCWLERLARVKT